jgi:predicted O-methyltransferase YrrM
MEYLKNMEGLFDIVFIDADKENYQQYYDMIIDHVNPGGYIIADNVLWSGKVVAELKKIDKDTQAILNFNAFVQSDERVENVLFPIRDGLLIARKK